MDKISGIIPSSPRVTNVDMKDAAPVRTSVPTFGRPEAATRTREADFTSNQPDWKHKDARQAAIVMDVASNFFMKTKPEVAAPTTEVAQEAALQQPDGLFPKGSFIDRNA